MDKDDNESVVTQNLLVVQIFMAISLSRIVDNLTKSIHKIKYEDFKCYFIYEKYQR